MWAMWALVRPLPRVRANVLLLVSCRGVAHTGSTSATDARASGCASGKSGPALQPRTGTGAAVRPCASACTAKCDGIRWSPDRIFFSFTAVFSAPTHTHWRMSLGAPLSASEVEFLAEFEPVHIIPNFEADQFLFVGVRDCVCFQPPLSSLSSRSIVLFVPRIHSATTCFSSSFLPCAHRLLAITPIACCLSFACTGCRRSVHPTTASGGSAVAGHHLEEPTQMLHSPARVDDLW